MAADILRELKGVVNFSCTPTSAADQHRSMLTLGGGSSGRAIDRFSPHLRDPLRARPLNPGDPSSSPPPPPPPPRVVHHIHTAASSSPKKATNSIIYKKSKEKRPTTMTTQQLMISPASSSRYLLGESDTWRFESAAKVQESTTKAVVKQEAPLQSIKTEQLTASSSSGGTRQQNRQVVVLRVSLHCKGCEGKVRKHLSKMEGVTSFATDLVNKKVTVMGDVTPLGVLNSISKVKNAQLWRPLPPKPS